MSSGTKDLRRRTKRSPLVRLRIFAFFIIVLGILAAWGGFAIATSPAFHVGSVAVTGNTRVSTAQILSAARIDSTANAWLLNKNEIAARVQAIPWIERARISRTLPARVELVITERVPAACLQAGRLVTIDATQRVLATSCLSPLLTQLAVPLKKPPVPGETIVDERVGQLVRDLAILTTATVPVRSLHLDRYGSLVAIDPHGVELKFGEDGDLAKKAALIEPIRRSTQTHGRSLYAIDVRAPQTPVVEYR